MAKSASRSLGVVFRAPVEGRLQADEAYPVDSPLVVHGRCVRGHTREKKPGGEVSSTTGCVDPNWRYDTVIRELQVDQRGAVVRG